jgi:predicted TIM-barrel fold metal-dependent hydrolase
VHVQADWDHADVAGEARWLQGIADAGSFPQAIVAFADLTRPDLGAVLDELAASRNVRGVRQYAHPADELGAPGSALRLLEDPRIGPGLTAVADRDWCIDLHCPPDAVPRAVKVLQAHEGLRVAICHAGHPRTLLAAPAGRSDWLAGLTQLASLPASVLKLSGLALSLPDANAAELAEPMRQAIEVFGPDRAMFGSNFPVDRTRTSLVILVEALELALAGLTEHERHAVRSGTALAHYRIEPASSALADHSTPRSDLSERGGHLEVGSTEQVRRPLDGRT